MTKMNYREWEIVSVTLDLIRRSNSNIKHTTAKAVTAVVGGSISVVRRMLDWMIKQGLLLKQVHSNLPHMFIANTIENRKWLHKNQAHQVLA